MAAVRIVALELSKIVTFLLYSPDHDEIVVDLVNAVNSACFITIYRSINLGNNWNIANRVMYYIVVKSLVHDV